MKVNVSTSKEELGRKAAAEGAQLIREAIAERGEANIIIATGASQFEMLEQLIKEPDIFWPAVTGFHLDEYVGMPITHPASFRNYLWCRFLRKLALPLKRFHYVDGEQDAEAECVRLGREIMACPIDIAFVGIGENGHMAFNDPPADFETKEPYLVVSLDEVCRKQQLGEGWFSTLEEVPQQAISMSINQILASKTIIASVPDERKAQAVKESIEKERDPQYPSTCLQQHEQTTLYLDSESASLLANHPLK